MRILIWPTTFGADLWSLTRYLDARDDTELVIALPDAENFSRQGISKLYPLRSRLVSRRAYHHVGGLRSFDPDVTIMDNLTPLRRTSPKAFMLWHGFGWKGPNDEKELRWLHGSLRRTWGDAREANPDFRWQCFGPWDREHRSDVSKIAFENCRLIGAASHDDLRTPLERSLAQPYYPFDVVNRPTVLLAPTWHYGGVFSHWGNDAEMIPRIVERVREHGANLIFRLHDSYRYERQYRLMLEDVAARFDNVVLKFKDEHPDNYLDLQVADVLLTNFSSIANLFYATGRPTVHIYPVQSADEEFLWRRYTIAGLRKERVERARYIWKLPPEENGGLLARSFDDVLEMTDRSLEDASCCTDRAREFVDEHMMGADGRACERAWNVLTELVGGGQPNVPALSGNGLPRNVETAPDVTPSSR